MRWAAGLTPSTGTAERVSSLIVELEKSIANLESASSHSSSSPLDEAKHLRDKVLPAMLQVRHAADALESSMADDLWPLPTYQEMLYIR